MRTVINDYVKNELGSGLMLLPLPTGFGKTYHATHSMYDIVTKSISKNKVLFITPQLKNLPYNDLRKVYEKEGRGDDFEKEVLLIKSNVDYVLDKILDLEIPEMFQNNAFDLLRQAVEEYKRLERNKGSAIGLLKPKLLNLIREEYEPNFRKHIIKKIKENLPKSIEERRTIIRTDKRYQWIAELYPTVFTNDYKIYMMSMKKFLSKNTVLVEPSYSFLSHSIVDGACIIIDEFDATKNTIQQEIIDKVIKTKIDFLELFMRIQHALVSHHVSGTLKCAYEQCIQYKKNTGELVLTLSELEREAKEITRIYHLNYSYKTRRDEINQSQNFLFADGTYHTILRNNKSYIRVTPNIEQENNIEINFEDRESYYKNRSDQDLNLYALIRRINGFLAKYEYLMLNWAKAYCDIENRRRDSTDLEFELENALKTIYMEYGLKQEEINVLMRDIGGRYSAKKTEGILPDMSFYASGFKYYQFIDRDEHLTKTKFHYVQVEDTPEKILLQLCNKAKVIGLSATAQIDSGLCNYDISYLKECLQDEYYVVPIEVIERLKRDFNKRLERYSEVDIKVKIIDENKGNTLNERLEDIFEESAYVDKYLNLFAISLKVTDGYIQERYCTIFKVFKEFISNPNVQSFLCLNMPHVKVGNLGFNLEIFKAAFKDIIEIVGVADRYKVEDILKILKGEEYEYVKEQIIEQLGAGDKIFVMSSYQTVGAGQNLQYKIPEGKEYITIYDLPGDKPKEKDFDGIFLGDVTNIVAKLIEGEEEQVKEDNLLKYLFQIEYLYQKDEISFSTLKQLIRRAFKLYGGGTEEKVYYQVLAKVRTAKSVQLQATKEVIQAIGRICRTPHKNSEIYIYTTTQLLSKLVTSCMDLELINPELRAVFDERERYRQQKRDSHEVLKNRAERIALMSKNIIMQMLTTEWSDETMALWSKLRDLVMKEPTADEKNIQKNAMMKSLFIELPIEGNRYWYAQRGDFSEVMIEFEEGGINSRNEGEGIQGEVSVEEARLQRILAYPGMREWFEEQKYALEFKENKYIMSPVLFHNIYKGALGENAGKYILKRELGIKLKEIEEADKFEFFDFEIAEGIYVDFKHWKQSYVKDRAETHEEIRRKLNKINGKKVYIINILLESNENYHTTQTRDGMIIEIPYLIDKNADINRAAIECLKEELR